jgi:DNA gyrase subunit A
MRLRVRLVLVVLQSNAILDTRLYRLAQLEIEEIRADLASKRAEAEQLEALLADAPGRWKLVRSELSNLSKRFADGRRTTLGGPDIKAQYSAEDFIIDEDVYVIVSRDGWLKRQRSYTDLAAIRVREGDSVGWSMWASTRKSLILFTDRGKAYTMRVDSVNATTGYGEPVQARFEFEDGERIVGAAVSDERSLPPCVECVSIPKNQLPFEPESDEELDASEKPSHCLLAMSKRGMVLRLPLQAFEAPSTVNGRTYMRLTGDDRVLSVFVSGGGEYVCLATENARALCFVVEEVPVLKSAGRGVRAVQLEGKDVVHTLCLARDASDGFEVNTQRGRNVMVTARRYPPIGRGGKGKVIEPRGKVVKVSTKVVVLEPPAAEKSEKSDARPAPQATTHDEEERGDELELPFALGRFVAVKRQSSADSDADSDADRESQDE